MKRKSFLFALSAVVLSVAGYVGYQCALKTTESDLFLANVEALSEGEEIPMLECSEAIEVAGCYRQWQFGEMWVCESIKAVRSYRVPVGSPIICHHDVVSDCPEGTFQK